MTLVKFSSRTGAGFSENREVAVEAFWCLQPLPWLSVKPDIQYVQNPGGDAAIDNALAFGLRLEWTF